MVLYPARLPAQPCRCGTPTTKDIRAIARSSIIPRSEHSISRANISANALKVLYTLKKAGFDAYLVGGGVRDLLLGREPKDFDVVTNAHPDEVRKLFRNCRLIGRRFRLAHVRFGREIIEVATFRGPAAAGGEADHLSVDGRIVRDNVYGDTLEEDAWRRDFTVNCLYYNIRDFSIVDLTGGLGDLEQGVLRLIGDARVRYREDPVRMLRAMRFAAKLGFRLDQAATDALPECAPLLEGIAPARFYDEVIKLFLGGMAVQSFELLNHHDLLKYLFPATAEYIYEHGETPATRLLLKALENTDTRIREDKPVTPAFLFAALLWGPVVHAASLHRGAGMTEMQAIDAAGSDMLGRQVRHVSLPRRFSLAAREIWSLQPRLEQRRGKRTLQLLGRPRFRAAYDFLLLRAEAGEDLAELAKWWTRLQEGGDAERRATAEGTGSRRRRRRRGRRRAPAP
ncbi:MAG: polynucleotide adenylyltransferase PcnB [Gammaproteobacteria bacterium]|nr:polynucleotide adenylyltransferase PcnB [Gammaproteobacteria bacterium]